MYAVTVEGHSLYESIGFGLQTESKALAIVTAEALSRAQFTDTEIVVWEKENNFPGLESWTRCYRVKDGRQIR